MKGDAGMLSVSTFFGLRKSKVDETIWNQKNCDISSRRKPGCGFLLLFFFFSGSVRSLSRISPHDSADLRIYTAKDVNRTTRSISSLHTMGFLCMICAATTTSTTRKTEKTTTTERGTMTPGIAEWKGKRVTRGFSNSEPASARTLW